MLWPNMPLTCKKRKTLALTIARQSPKTCWIQTIGFTWTVRQAAPHLRRAPCGKNNTIRNTANNLPTRRVASKPSYASKFSHLTVCRLGWASRQATLSIKRCLLQALASMHLQRLTAHRLRGRTIDRISCAALNKSSTPMKVSARILRLSKNYRKRTRASSLAIEIIDHPRNLPAHHLAAPDHGAPTGLGQLQQWRLLWLHDGIEDNHAGGQIGDRQGQTCI